MMKEAAERLYPHLAGYVDETWNVLYANREYARIYRRIVEVGNVLTWFFAVPESKAVMVEWETEARLTVAWLRSLMVRRPANPVFPQILEDLSRSPEFISMWDRQEVVMGRHTPYMLVRDLDNDVELSLLAQVYPSPDPTQSGQMYLGIKP